jgi:hypothetical protein
MHDKKFQSLPATFWSIKKSVNGLPGSNCSGNPTTAEAALQMPMTALGTARYNPATTQESGGT